ncbi:Uncharacterised protein [uncultured archaeon]|nr:Uncharacterised protein [uncultured archaeon]
MRSKLAQVWVETVIYTLIALILIGTVLAFAKPKIEQLQDKALIEQSLEIMDSINSNVLNVVQGGPGNKRVIDIGLKKGSITIDGPSKMVYFKLEGTRSMYSEPGAAVMVGDVNVTTIKKAGNYDVTLTDSYPNYEIMYNGNPAGVKTVTKAPNPYKFVILNNGTDPTTGLLQINFEII